MANPKFLVMADLHKCTGCSDTDWFYGGQDEYRRYSTAQTRAEAASSDAASNNVDFIMSLGDLVDGKSKDENDVNNALAHLADTYTGDIYTICGNHEYTYVDTFEIVSWSEYSTKRALPSVDSTWMADSIVKGFSFYNNGLYYLCIDGCTQTFDREGDTETQGTWIQNTLASAPAPVVVFCHQHLADTYKSPHYVKSVDRETIRGYLEANNNVIAVIQGHWHNGYPNSRHHIPIINGIPYYSCKGSVNAHQEADNSYYIFEIIPNATGLNTANIKVTRFNSTTAATQDTYRSVDFQAFSI